MAVKANDLLPLLLLLALSKDLFLSLSFIAGSFNGRPDSFSFSPFLFVCVRDASEIGASLSLLLLPSHLHIHTHTHTHISHHSGMHITGGGSWCSLVQNLAQFRGLLLRKVVWHQLQHQIHQHQTTRCIINFDFNLIFSVSQQANNKQQQRQTRRRRRKATLFFNIDKQALKLNVLSKKQRRRHTTFDKQASYFFAVRFFSSHFFASFSSSCRLVPCHTNQSHAHSRFVWVFYSFCSFSQSVFTLFSSSFLPSPLLFSPSSN